MMEKNAKIYVAGHRGMVGSAIVRELKRQGYENIITRTHKELDLCRQDAVEAFFAEEKPEYVFLAAAKVGGIVANQEALADFMYDNMTLEMNVIHSAWKNGCKKLEFLGSSCIYPRMAPQPMKENCLLTGDDLKVTNCRVKDFRVVFCFAYAHVDNDLIELRHFHDILITKFLDHCFNDLVLVHFF